MLFAMEILISVEESKGGGESGALESCVSSDSACVGCRCHLGSHCCRASRYECSEQRISPSCGSNKAFGCNRRRESAWIGVIDCEGWFEISLHPHNCLEDG